MALSDIEIWMELQASALVINPLPDATSVNAASVDLRLDKVVQLYKDVPAGTKIDLADASATAQVAYHGDHRLNQ